VSFQTSKTWTSCYSEGVLRAIEVQVLIRKGISRFDIIGLPQNMIREGKDRIYAALAHLGLELPSQKILVNLNPGNILLRALGHLPQSDALDFYWGELQLDGRIRQVDGILAHLLFANQFKAERLISAGPLEYFDSLQSYLRAELIFSKRVHDLILNNDLNIKRRESKDNSTELDAEKRIQQSWLQNLPKNPRWEQIRASSSQLDFLCIVALGRQHLLLSGSPGVGKSTVCKSLLELQRPLLPSQWIERFRFQGSQHKVFRLQQLSQAPFEEPHHSSSKASIVGGGTKQILAGCITKAHQGILLLDEIAEFNRDVLEALREPLENKLITVARTGVIQQLPADIQLLATMNPCACGKFRSKKVCECSQADFNRYKRKISEPLRDRIHWKTWWEFKDEKPEAKIWSLKEVRQRLLAGLNSQAPSLGHLQVPKHLNPRSQRLWLESLVSWARWHGISELSTQDAADFENFRKEMEDEEDGNERIDRAEIRRFGAQPPTRPLDA
jgi:magnesium chelatase family protein